jgi:hypothetical protein
LVYYEVDTSFYKDMVFGLMYEEGRTRWHISAGADEDYLRQVSSEQKILLRDAKGRMKETWAPKPGHPQNHYWASECYGMAAAHMSYVQLIKSAPGGAMARAAAERDGNAERQIRLRY